MALQISGRTYGIGEIVAFLVLVACLVLFLMGTALTPGLVLALIAALALARLI